MACFIVQWLSIYGAETAEHEGGRDHALVHSSVVEHLRVRNGRTRG